MKKIVKGWRVVFTSLMALCLVLGLFPVKTLAEEYTYQVTFYSGNQGTFNGTEGLSVDNHSSGSQYAVEEKGDEITVSGLKQGDIVSFDVQAGAVQMADDSKYYLRGIRQSGRDNDTVQTSAFRVDGDAEYVLAYGIRGNQTGYTVNYQDAQGNELAPSRTYYGNVGDKPVVAYLYIEDYNPQTLALTRTLSENEAENVFTFVYTPVPTEVITEPGDTITNTTTVTETVPGTTDEGTAAGTGTGTAGTGTAGTGTGTAGTAGEGAGAAGTAGEGTGAAGEGTGAAGTDETGTAGTDGTAAGETDAAADEGTTDIQDEEVPQDNQDLTDLDEEEVPQSNINIDEEEVKKGLPMVAGVAIGVLAVAALGVIIVLVRKRMK